MQNEKSNSLTFIFHFSLLILNFFSSLPLFMLGIFANHANDALAADDLAVVTQSFDG